MTYIAHTTIGGRTQTVKEHLENTAKLSGYFAAAFDAGSAGYYTGLLHDIGKYSLQFQERIAGRNIRVDHSTAGAQEALKNRQQPTAFAIAGHHSGIPDGGSRVDTADASSMVGRSKRELPDYRAWKSEIHVPSVTTPGWLLKTDNFTLSFFTRMLYSCLVDADYLDTEAFMQGEQPRSQYESLVQILEKLRNKTNEWLNNPDVSQINAIRNDILKNCINTGRNGRDSLYTLTVPTGGGKTIASLSFALERAVSAGKDRIIYVIPYTSIIDQTAAIFQSVLGTDNVLAHYACADYRLKDRENLTPQEYRKLLASENWDMPVIITTAVQFFESLYANRSSRCRKLHNIANSVVIFDEAQTLPINYLKPCIAAIAQLVLHYKVIAVLCTATQPELAPLFGEYLPGISAKEISRDIPELYRTFKRTVIRNMGCIPEDRLVKRLSVHEQVLCVVNKRSTAQKIFAGLPEEGRYCLTTLLCPYDRRNKLDEIRRRLKNGFPCRVVSTSLIEAGVDVDFPAVYREEAGLDSILQSAGRCNREGREKDPNNRPVYVFILEEGGVPPMLRQQVSAFRAVLGRNEEPDSPGSVSEYFKTLLYKIKDDRDLDKKGILDAFKRGRNGCLFPFARVAEEFSIIDTPAKVVYVPVGEGSSLCERLMAGDISRELYRKLGIYSVSVYPGAFQDMYNTGIIRLVDENTAVLVKPDVYDGDTGLKIGDSGSEGIFI